MFSRASHGKDAPDSGQSDHARFRREVLPHLNAAYSYARYLVRDGTAAEDIVQDAFLRAWKNFDACRGSAKPWLLTIVRNCFYDWARANMRPTSQHEWLEDHADLTAERQPEDALLRVIDLEMMRETIMNLPEPFRETLVLRELEELSYREIADLTAAPIGTVMSRLARGRDMLARVMLDHNQGAYEL